MTSPYNLVQEQQLGKPCADWRILVVCALLNRTHGRQVRPIIDRVFELAPTPTDMIDRLGSAEMDDALRPLGLINRRRHLLQSICQGYLFRRIRVAENDEEDGYWASYILGCGAYAVASLNIVLYGRTDSETDDVWLTKYRNWAISRKESLQ